jgi:hypothetical protein
VCHPAMMLHFIQGVWRHTHSTTKLCAVIWNAVFCWQVAMSSYCQEPTKNTPACRLLACRLSLSQFNPMLEGVVNVKEGGQLLSTYAPEGGQLPALRGQVSLLKIQCYLCDCRLEISRRVGSCCPA